MNRKMSFVFILSVLFTINYVTAQQEKHFSGNPNEFIDQLTDFFGENLTEKDKDILETFENEWKTDSLTFLTPEKRSGIIDITNLFYVKKAHAVPQYRDFLRSVISFKNNTQNEDNYDPWKKGLTDLLNREKFSLTDISSYLSFTHNILDSGFLFNSSSTRWKVSTPDFNINTGKEITVTFKKTDITCFSLRDSISIFNTSGEYDPVNSVWKGKNGLITWERAGFSRDSVFAELSEYRIEMNRSEYTAENVTFTNKYFFSKPLKGVLEDKVKHNQGPDDATYPKFNSYQKDFVVKNLYENINYEGGLSMQGSKLIGKGSKSENASITVFRKDTLLLRANSKYFAFKSDRINGISASVVIKLHHDSIFHPGLEFRYMVASKELSLSRSERYTSQSPYFNSYHNIDMTFEQLVWKIDEPLMYFKAPIGATEGIAGFESTNYFNFDYYMKLQGMDEVHPLISIRSFARSIGSELFSATDFADYLRMPVHLVKQLLMRMSVAGFVYYDTNTEMATIKPKLHSYIAASVGKIDFDVISIPSRTTAPLENAVFNFSTYDLTINGISQIFVSDSQNVMIVPKRERIVMKKNRSFQFDGIVFAGLLKFQGQNFYFDYDSFKIDLQNVDILALRFLTGAYDNYGLPVTDVVNSEIKYVTGELLVDNPDNKSGRNSNPEYPVFVSRENSFVFYNHPEIFNGVYEQEDFYFELDPYTMDSLDNFRKESLRFSGKLVSSGIFPVIEETLLLRPDKSLGFAYTTPGEGLPLYGGKGQFKNDIDLSNQGLRGQGTIEYLTSVTNSDDILFFPDSVNLTARDFTIAKTTTGTQFPQVNSRNNYIHWLPYDDVMYASIKDADFTMFNDTTHLIGTLALKPDGLSGSGRMDLKNSDLVSNSFTYKSDEIFADSSDFFLKSLHSAKFTVQTENVKSHIDYTTRKGYFTSNEEYSLVNFPENKYISYIDRFTWDMTNKELAMGTPGDYTFEGTANDEDVPAGPTYISTDPDQDSLKFISPLAYYDYQNNTIKATGVKYIEVADARIYPANGDVVVEQNALIRKLEKSRIVANQLSKYHTFLNASVLIHGKNSFEGEGDYDYIDENEEVQNIHFKQISVDNAFQTIASSEIFEPDSFKLSPVYSYQGKVFLTANNKLLTFNGAVMINHICDIIEPKWLDFTTVIDPGNIYIPVPDQAVDINNNRIYSGILMHYDSVHLYPAFFTNRKEYSDRNLIPASGFLYYDRPSQLFKISSMQKLADRDTSGNYLSLHRETCEMYGEGKIDLGINLGMVNLVSAGNFRHYINENKTTIDLVMGMDFMFNENILNIMTAELDSVQGLQAVDLNRSTYNKAMVEIAGKDAVNGFKEELNLFGSVKSIPGPLKHTFVFNDLKFEWNNETNSYISVGKIGIASINNKLMNKLFDGMIEIQVKRSGNICDIYIEGDRRTWYYFGYTRGVMQVLSSNKEFLNQIIALKNKDRKQKASEKSLDSYIYMVSTDRKKDIFYRRYLDILEERNSQKNE